MTLSLLLEMAANAAPDAEVLRCDGRGWSGQALLAAAQGAATLIRESGCTTVGLLDEASEAAAVAMFGALIAGVAYVPLNYRLADPDLAELLERLKPALLVGDAARAARLGAEPAHLFDRKAFMAAALANSGTHVEAIDDGSAVAIQLFTSGTTAAPKAAMLRHANLLSYILGTVDFGSAAPGEAALVSVPPYHIAGIAALLSSIYAGRRILLLPAFDPDAWLRLARDEGATNAFLVPTMLARIVARLEVEPELFPSTLKAIAYGGGRMPPELIERALQLFPDTGFTNAYGLTETSSTIALLGPDDHRAAKRSEDPSVRARLGSVGRPLPTVEIEIRDEAGRVLPAGERGEIFVRGEQVSGEYRERSALDPDGWFPTRDAGWMDEAGYLFLGGRADDVIVRGGENISPGEIEAVLAAHPAIADVAAVAAPSLEWGETVAVVCALKPGAEAPDPDALRQMVRARLRSSRVPEHVRFVEALPHNEMGKLLRRELRQLFEN